MDCILNKNLTQLNLEYVDNSWSWHLAENASMSCGKFLAVRTFRLPEILFTDLDYSCGSSVSKVRV